MGEWATTQQRRGRHALADEELSRVALHRLEVSLGHTSMAPSAPPDREPVSATPDAEGWVPRRPPPGDGRRATGPARRPWRDSVADRLPVGLRAAVVTPSGRAVLGLLVVAAVAVSATGAAAWVSRPQARSAPDRPSVESSLAGSPLAGSPVADEQATSPAQPVGTTTPGTPVLVHVAGAVRRPGLVELPPGSRVADAVEAAGGLTPKADPASVNLARPAIDGEQVVVARRGEPAMPVPVGGTSLGASPTGPVNLNTATLEQLDSLPGIGPVLAQRVLDWRTANGRFSAVDELGEVSGIGEATLSDLRPLVTV